MRSALIDAIQRREEMQGYNPTIVMSRGTWEQIVLDNAKLPPAPKPPRAKAKPRAKVVK